MKSGVASSARAAAAVLGFVATLAVAQPSHPENAPAEEADVIARVVVTAQRREENLIDVPIAVSAFDSLALERRQIDQATDLQLNVPNVAYTKTNFTNSNLQIRGIGLSSVGPSGDSGVETHFNFMPIRNPRLFETEYFDVERVEVLRGPQGTLYGRNATGGAVNIVPRKPSSELAGNVELETGDYGTVKVKGAINLPLEEQFAARFAGVVFQRDGYTRNLFTGNDIDGRDQYSVRGALRFTPSTATDVVLTVNHFKEDSTRMRVGKQMCHRDPTGAYGCLPDRLAFEPQNMRGTLAGTLAELVPLALPGAAPFALIPAGVDINQGAVVPADMRQTNAEFDPVYDADETIVMLELSHHFGRLTLTSITGYQETMFRSRTDYNWIIPTRGYAPGGLAFMGGSVPLSDLGPGLRGSLDDVIVGRYTRSSSFDQSEQDADQWSQELRLSSALDGPLDFQIGGLYLDSTDDNNFYVMATDLDYAARLLGLQPPYYSNATPEASLRSTAVFGELYWDMTDTFKWTAGLRWTRDEKGIKDRQLLLALPASSALPPFRTDETSFEEFTGRFGIDWKPGWLDDSTLYAFYSRGYKAGGFNPPTQGNVALSSVPPVYEPEFIDAFEVGAKSVFAGGRVRANLTGFVYDYNGLQVSKIVARTSVNENIDADIFGFEGELVFRATDALLVDLNFAYLSTSIQDASSIDPRDPSGGNPNFTVVKDIANGSNYVLPVEQVQAGAGGCLMPRALGGPFGLYGLNRLPQCRPGAFGQADGIPVDLDGNHLAGAPEWSAKVGAQYTWAFSSGMSLTARADYYWRDDFYGRIFNAPIDRIDSWDILNAQVEIAGAQRHWYLRGYVDNVMDDDNITGMYVTDASAGLFTNVFTLEPRTYGLVLGVQF